MNSINFLKSIIQNLTIDEKKLIFKYLSNNNEKNKNDGTKSILLFKLLSNEINYSYSEIQNIIYSKANYYALNKLSIRLRQKIFEIILLDNSMASNKFSKRNLILLDLRKKLLLTDILQLKGLRNQTLPLYNTIINKSNKFELYDIKLQALSSIQRLQISNLKLAQIKKLNDEIIFTEKCQISLKKSNSIYVEIINKINAEPDNIKYKTELNNSVKKLQKYYKFTKSPIIGFYLNTLVAGIYQNKLLFKEAHGYLDKVKNILLNSESAYTDNRFGNVLLNFANNYIYLFLFDKSIEFALKSKMYLSNLPFSLKIVDEIMFYAYFYKFDFNNCKKILIDNDFIFENETLKSKFYYFEACLFFINKRYLESLNSLRDCKEIDKDKEGWNINRRILTILNRIELEDYDSVDLQVQNLIRFIKRNLRSRLIKPRYLLILKILSNLINENYNFNTIYKNKYKYINLLEEKNKEYSWVIKSPELIIFHDWFASKINNNVLNSSINIYIEN